LVITGVDTAEESNLRELHQEVRRQCDFLSNTMPEGLRIEQSVRDQIYLKAFMFPNQFWNEGGRLIALGKNTCIFVPAN
jgi:hypothetical protein